MGRLIITNASVCDGSGSEPFLADVVIAGERIEEVRRRDASSAPLSCADAEVIDAAGKLVTPGFIDAHSHSDFNILVNPQAESKLRQGITTEIVGCCGYSAFPLAGPVLEEEREANARVGLDVDWADAAGYFERVAKAKPAVNIGTFVGHCNLRGIALGYEDRKPEPRDMSQMAREVEIGMEAGAIGLSTGLIYAPGMFAATEELVELQKVAARHGGIYSSHVRGEGDTLLEAADEFMQVVEGADCQGQFSHLKASGPRNWGKAARVLEQIDAANDKGRCVRFDRYPYIASSTSLRSMLPRRAIAGGRDAALERLRDPGERQRIVAEARENNEGRDGWASVLIVGAGCEEYEQYQGLSIAQIGEKVGKSGDEVFVDLLVASRMSTSICNFTMDQEETDRILAHGQGMVGTDAALRAPYGPLSKDRPHPRSYGSFGKFFREYVKERRILGLAEAVRKSTSFPCETFRLKDRGLVRAGCFADLLVIDWEAFRDRSAFADPHRYCDGIELIVVNGVVTLSNGEQTGQRGGRLLLRGTETAG